MEQLNGCASLTVKNHNPENLIIQHLRVKKTINPYKNNRLEGNNRMRNGIILDILMSVDLVELAKCGGNILEDF